MERYSKFDIMGQGRQSWGESEISGCLWKGNGRVTLVVGAQLEHSGSSLAMFPELTRPG